MSKNDTYGFGFYNINKILERELSKESIDNSLEKLMYHSRQTYGNNNILQIVMPELARYNIISEQNKKKQPHLKIFGYTNHVPTGIVLNTEQYGSKSGGGFQITLLSKDIVVQNYLDNIFLEPITAIHTRNINQNHINCILNEVLDKVKKDDVWTPTIIVQNKEMLQLAEISLQNYGLKIIGDKQ